MVKKNIRILVSPLDWGLGHASRCVPIIKALQGASTDVVIGSSGRALEFLKGYFPNLEMLELPSLEIRYPANGTMATGMASQLPSILFQIRKEHRYLSEIIKTHRIDGVISDNRFGMWSDRVPSVYITHQVRIKGPKGWKFAEPFLASLHRYFIKHYQECWIPDLPGAGNLSGDLGHPVKLPENYFYVGPLSRFPVVDTRPAGMNDNKDLLVLLSGPEPQRGIFEGILLRELEQRPGLHATVLRGMPGEDKVLQPFPNTRMYSHLPDGEMQQLILGAKFIICRSGYSTLMDLVSLGKSAILVPTPGQTEQEYLARYHASGMSYHSISQEDFNLDKALEAHRKLAHPAFNDNGRELLEKGIERIITLVRNSN